MPAHSHSNPLRSLLSLPVLPSVVVGAVLLFFGRKLFWLFVGAVGFLVGVEVAAVLFPHQPDWSLIAGLILGLIGAIAAVLVQKIAIGIAGFLAGGYFLMSLLRAWTALSPDMSWISFLIGGVVGALLMYAIFDWTLIFLSSISGAHLIVHPFVLSHAAASVAVLVLAIIGILAQARMFTSPRDEPA